jgi:hypothetical protein
MDDAEALSASWLFLSAKRQAGRPIAGVIPDSIAGLQSLCRYQSEIEEVSDDQSNFCLLGLLSLLGF